MLPRGIRLNNPGNIRKYPDDRWIGEVVPGSDAEFAEFSTMGYGIRAMSIVLTNYVTIYGCRTIAEIINRYSPPVENDTQAYIDDVCHIMRVTPDIQMPSETHTPIYARMLSRLIFAICIQENGPGYVTEDDVIAGMALAAFSW